MLRMRSTLHVMQASQASATDLRLWSSYVQLLALLGSRLEAIKVAEKALSMLQVRRFIYIYPRIQHSERVHSAQNAKMSRNSWK